MLQAANSPISHFGATAWCAVCDHENDPICNTTSENLSRFLRLPKDLSTECTNKLFLTFHQRFLNKNFFLQSFVEIRHSKFVNIRCTMFDKISSLIHRWKNFNESQFVGHNQTLSKYWQTWSLIDNNGTAPYNNYSSRTGPQTVNWMQYFSGAKSMEQLSSPAAQQQTY